MPRRLKPILHVSLVALALIGLLAWARVSAPDPTASASGAVRLDPARFDFGAISMRNGPVRQELTLRNAATSAVNLTRLTTSCMCTKAELTLDGQTFGPFGMPGHGAIPALHRAYRAVFLRAATIAEFNALWSHKQKKALAAAIDEDIPAGPERDEVHQALKEARAIVNAHNQRFAAGFRARKVPSFLTDDAQYQTVRALFLEGRVFMLRGDLTADRAMAAFWGHAQRTLGAHLPVERQQYFPTTRATGRASQRCPPTRVDRTAYPLSRVRLARTAACITTTCRA